MGISFAKAVKHEAKGRIAIIGPAGSGKSYTMLTAARTLAGPKGKIACIDTEQGSLEKYADLFDFDVCPLSEFTAPNFLEALHAAEKGGYDVFCCDSLSHFWMGKGGALEFVDAASMRGRGGDGMSGWKEFRPLERAMTDAMISSPLHIICTMRTKTAYEEQVNPKTGKKQRVKIGLAPVQRDGLEYEFDLVGSMTEDNCFVVDKTRCSALAGKAIDKPKMSDFEVFEKWLSGAQRAPQVTDSEINDAHLKLIADAKSMEELRTFYGEAYKWAVGKGLKSDAEYFVRVYGERKEQLESADLTDKLQKSIAIQGGKVATQ